MRAFNFRLETLLHLRELSKDRALASYGEAVSLRKKRTTNYCMHKRLSMNYSGKSHYVEALVLMVQVKVLLIDHYWPQKSGSLHAIPICSELAS